MMIMLLIPRLLVVVAVMLIFTDVGVIARRWFTFGGQPKPSPYPGRWEPRPPIFQRTREENIYRPNHPDLFSRNNDYDYNHRNKYNDDSDLSSRNNGYNPGYKYNDDLDLFSRITDYNYNPRNKYDDDSELQKLLKSPETNHQGSTLSAPVNQKNISSENSGFGLKPSKSYNDKMFKADFSNINRNSHTKFMSDLREMIQRLKQAQSRFIPSTPVNQKLNTTSEQPRNPKVATISTTIKADTPLVDKLQDPSTNLGKGLGLISLPVPVKWEEPSTWNVTKTSRGTQFKTPGATVERNLKEKKLQTTKNLGQPQLPAEN